MHNRTSKKEKKRLILITSLILFLLFILVASVRKDWQQILENRRLEIELTNKYKSLLNDEIALNAEITKLQDNDYLARYAKEKYMLSSEGDTIIKMD